MNDRFLPDRDAANAFWTKVAELLPTSAVRLTSHVHLQCAKHATSARLVALKSMQNISASLS